jgi:hypothetical protein
MISKYTQQLLSDWGLSSHIYQSDDMSVVSNIIYFISNEQNKEMQVDMYVYNLRLCNQTV